MSKDLSDAYILSENMPSTLRRAYKSIETRAMKIGQLPHRSEEQRGEVRPILRKQTQSMRALLQDGRLINHHQDELMEIQGSIYKVLHPDHQRQAH